jgi:arylsulfatase A-like enzyme
VAFIKSHKQSPFLCYIPFNAIHGPFQAPRRLVEQFSDEADDTRRLVKAMLHSLDQNVGKVIQCVQNNDLESRTLIIFLSDNGGHDHSPNTPLRGKKGTMWEGGIRIPFCMQWQGMIPAESTYHRPVSSLDILPTAIAAAGGTIAPEWKLDGVNLLPYVCQKNMSEERPHNELYWSLGPRLAIRDLDYKLATDDGKIYRLFDLATDRSEERNLMESKPALANRLRKKLHNWKDTLPPNNSGWNPKIGPRRPDFGAPQPYHQSLPAPSL